MSEDVGAIRRMRVFYFREHHPPVWAAHYMPPGRSACYIWTDTLDQMWRELRKYFAGDGLIPPLRVEARFAAPSTPDTLGDKP